VVVFAGARFAAGALAGRAGDPLSPELLPTGLAATGLRHLDRPFALACGAAEAVVAVRVVTWHDVSNRRSGSARFDDDEPVLNR
jgi:hypothetical protein